MIKTYSPKPSEITHDWYVIDATDQALGRLSTQAATYLMGKHKPQFSGHIDCGDNIVIINASKIRLTGNKLEDKKYYRHSGYPGGIKETSAADLIERNPARILETAIAGMLPKNKLRDDRLYRLKVYPTAEHPHGPQSPKPLQENK